MVETVAAAEATVAFKANLSQNCLGRYIDIIVACLTLKLIKGQEGKNKRYKRLDFEPH